MKELNGMHKVTAEVMIPDLLRAHPELRVVLDRYGLRGCGGPLGPAETIGYFARAHGVDVEQLVKELNEGLCNPDTLAGRENRPAVASESERAFMDQLADTIYRRFFKAGVVVVMTAGAVWGAILLLRIGFGGSFTSIPIHEINAHGHAQIFGWVGLFVMGFAYQAFPRMKHTNLWRPDLANMTFYLMVFGIFARALGEPLFRQPMFRELAVAANLAEIAAIGLFIVIIARTFRLSGKALELHDGYILAAMGFFLVQAVYDLGLLYGTTAPGETRERLLYLVSIYQGPLRDLQIHGFAMLMILGVGLRMFPALFGLHAPRPTAARLGLVVLAAAVIGESVFFILLRRYGTDVTKLGLYVSMVALALTSIALTARWGLLARPTEQDRSVKFVRAAVVWLHVSMLMLLFAPLYGPLVLAGADALSASGARGLEIGFSHAYGGAVRHAITVGFISLTILGMAAKVVPTLGGVDVRHLRPLWIPFVLVNAGCLMRVAFQVGTDFAEWAYPVAGISGLLEVAGIGVWGLHLWRIMAGWRPADATAHERPARITAEHKIGQVVEWFPQTLPLLIEKGFTPLANPIMRRTLARAISIRQAAAQHGIDVEVLLTELNRTAFGEGDAVNTAGRSSELPLPVLADGRQA